MKITILDETKGHCAGAYRVPRRESTEETSAGQEYELLDAPVKTIVMLLDVQRGQESPVIEEKAQVHEHRL